MKTSKQVRHTRTIKQRAFPEDDLPSELAAPARRALAAAGIRRLEQLSGRSEDEVKRLHGIGPNALAALRRALSSKGLAFRKDGSAGTA